MINTDISETTQRQYKQMAKSFITKHQLYIDENGDTLCEALISVSPDYRPDYWRNLRNALSYYLFIENQQELAERVRRLKNPITDGTQKIKPKPKQKRCKKVTTQEREALIMEAMNQKKRTLVAAIYIANITGCRPCEMPFITQMDDVTFKILGGKKRADRGLDRLLIIDDPSTAKLIGKLIKVLRNQKMKPIQNAFVRLAKKVFWRRKITPSLYSFRHQIGSDLKASGIDRKTVAYMMGHRVTKSVNVYGNRRSAGGRGIQISPAISDAEIDQLVKENHQLFLSREPKNRSLNAPK